MIRIDGSFGEGGGQILRYAACFAAATSKEVEVYNIRAKRPNPGLRPQHLAVLNIMKQIFGGEVLGARVGSTKVIFKFGEKRINRLVYNIGTAGSVTLILQSIIPALAYKRIGMEIRLIGGTDVKWSPTSDYMKYAYATLVEKFGVTLDIKVIRRGYYPKGGGIVDVAIRSDRLTATNLTRRGKIDQVKIVSVVSNLPKHIAERQISTVKKILTGYGLRDVIDIEEDYPDRRRAYGPGVSLVVVGRNIEYKIYSGGDSIGERGKPAEKVGEEAAKRFLDWYQSKAALDIFQSDMVIPYIALSGGGEYTAPDFSSHMKSALYVMKEILGRDYEITQEKETYKIKIL